MKKLILAAVVASTLLSTSCNSNDDSMNSEGPTLPVKATPEEVKQKLEDNIVNVLNKVEQYSNDASAKEIDTFLTFINEHSLDPETIEITEKSLNTSKLSITNTSVRPSRA